MPSIDITTQTKERLEKAKRSNETYDDVIQRLLEAASKPLTTQPGGATPIPGLEPQPIPERPPESTGPEPPTPAPYQ